MLNDGENSNGSRFAITLGKADIFDSYQTVFGELVEGDDILKQLEDSVDRLGHVKNSIKIDAAGTK
jgi:cyclophilin family peptidyl-prolyl cis-trans isomerase